MNNSQREEFITQFLNRIYMIKMLISAHWRISENSLSIKHKSFFGMLQSVTFNRVVLVELFNILDQNRNGVTLTKLVEGMCECKKLLESKLSIWTEIINPLKIVRDKR